MEFITSSIMQIGK